MDTRRRADSRSREDERDASASDRQETLRTCGRRTIFNISPFTEVFAAVQGHVYRVLMKEVDDAAPVEPEVQAE